MSKRENRIFSLKSCISALPDFKQVASLIYSVLILPARIHAAL